MHTYRCSLLVSIKSILKRIFTFFATSAIVLRLLFSYLIQLLLLLQRIIIKLLKSTQLSLFYHSCGVCDLKGNKCIYVRIRVEKNELLKYCKLFNKYENKILLSRLLATMN